MIHRRRFLTLFAAALFAATLNAHPALAQSLNKLRSAGVVGEKFNGLAVVRDAGASAKVRKTVEDVNKKRRQIYAKRAAEQGVPADQVGRKACPPTRSAGFTRSKFFKKRQREHGSRARTAAGPKSRSENPDDRAFA
jgi:uncharacterized protein YdbL (DUF1318 family)